MKHKIITAEQISKLVPASLIEEYQAALAEEKAIEKQISEIDEGVHQNVSKMQELRIKARSGRRNSALTALGQTPDPEPNVSFREDQQLELTKAGLTDLKNDLIISLRLATTEMAHIEGKLLASIGDNACDLMLTYSEEYIKFHAVISGLNRRNRQNNNHWLEINLPGATSYGTTKIKTLVGGMGERELYSKQHAARTAADSHIVINEFLAKIKGVEHE